MTLENPPSSTAAKLASQTAEPMLVADTTLACLPRLQDVPSSSNQDMVVAASLAHWQTGPLLSVLFRPKLKASSRTRKLMVWATTLAA
jgi:hypothetical protein